MNVHIIKSNKPVKSLVEKWLKEEEGIIIVEIIYIKTTITIEKDTSDTDNYLSSTVFAKKVTYSATIMYIVVEN